MSSTDKVRVRIDQCSLSTLKLLNGMCKIMQTTIIPLALKTSFIACVHTELFTLTSIFIWHRNKTKTNCWDTLTVMSPAPYMLFIYFWYLLIFFARRELGGKREEGEMALKCREEGETRWNSEGNWRFMVRSFSLLYGWCMLFPLGIILQT